MKQLCRELNCPKICFVGDFHAGVTYTFGVLLENFCDENDFIIPTMHYYSRTHSHTLVMHTTQLLDRPFYILLFSASSNVQYGSVN